MRRWGAIAAAFYIGLVQLILAAHAASADALAPDHDQTQCAYCVAADRGGPAPPSINPLVLRVIESAAVFEDPKSQVDTVVFFLAAAPRGPPIH